MATKTVRYRHGMCDTPTYSCWVRMRVKCQNTEYSNHEIKYCPEWEKFENFLKDMGEKPKDKELCRIDVNGMYEPSNCIWADKKRKITDRKNSTFLTYQGVTKHVSEWVKITGLKYDTLMSRINKGWSVEDALTVKAWERVGRPKNQR